MRHLFLCNLLLLSGICFKMTECLGKHDGLDYPIIPFNNANNMLDGKLLPSGRILILDDFMVTESWIRLL